MLLLLIICVVLLVYVMYNVSLFNNTQRDVISMQWTTDIRCYLAIMIVACHIDKYLLGTYYSSSIDNETELLIYNDLGYWGSIVVSIFFFISGYGLVSSYKRKGRSYLDHFMTRRLPGLLIPFFICIVIEYFLRYRYEANFDGYSSIIRFIVRGEAFQWFVVVLFCFYLLFFVSYKYFSCKMQLWILTLGVVMFTIFQHSIHWAYISSNLAFLVGVFYKSFEDNIVRLLNTFGGKGVASCLIICIIFCIQFIVTKRFSILVNLWVPILFGIFSYYMVLPHVYFLSKLSALSYEMYLMQYSAFIFVGSLNINYHLAILLLFIIVFILSAIANYINNRIIKSVNCFQNV